MGSLGVIQLNCICIALDHSYSLKTSHIFKTPIQVKCRIYIYIYIADILLFLI